MCYLRVKLSNSSRTSFIFFSTNSRFSLAFSMVWVSKKRSRYEYKSFIKSCKKSVRYFVKTVLNSFKNQFYLHCLFPVCNFLRKVKKSIDRNRSNSKHLLVLILLWYWCVENITIFKFQYHEKPMIFYWIQIFCF